MLILLPHIPTHHTQKILQFVLQYICGIPTVGKESDSEEQNSEFSQDEVISTLNRQMEQDFDESWNKIPIKKKKRVEIEHVTEAKKSGLFPVVFTGLYLILRSAIRQKLRNVDFVDQCTRLQVHEPVLQLLTQMYEKKKEQLIQVSKDRSSWFQTVINVRWRIDVTISTSVMSRVFKPVLMLQLELSNGSVRTMEVSLQQFHELRLACATALNDMMTVSNHPVMLIKEKD